MKGHIHCSSVNCPLYTRCRRAYDTGHVIDYMNHGSGYAAGGFVSEAFDCGPNGGYAMFVPLGKERK